MANHDCPRSFSNPAVSPNEDQWASMLEIRVKEDPLVSGKAQPGAYPPAIVLLKRVGAEFVGTFLLIFAAAGSNIVNEKTNGGLTDLGVSMASGLAVMMVILSTGHISGAHVNPAVTLAFATIKEFPWSQVPFYFAAQIGASVLASFTLKLVFEPADGAGLTVPSGTVVQALVVEFLITFSLMFVVTAVATDNRAVGELAGLAVGATVVLNNLVAGSITGASMNPVRTLGPAIVANDYRGVWIYIVGPVVGSLSGTATYTLVRFNNADGTSGGKSIRR